MSEAPRQPLPSDAADAYRARREALHRAVMDLDHELAEIGARAHPDARRFHAAVAQLLERVREHIDEAEEPGSLLDQIVDAAPWLAPRTQQLRDEHASLLGRSTELVERARVADDVTPLLAQARELSKQVADHRHRGTTLLLDAYLLDVPAGD